VTDRICPSCGQKALSVATRCPRCGLVFIGLVFESGTGGVRSRRRSRGSIIVGVVAMVLAGIALWWAARSGQPHDLSTTETAARRTGPIPSQPRDTAVSRADSPVTVPGPVTSPEVGASATLTARSESMSRTGRLRRVASTWANVRAERSPRAAVIRVLRPGDVIEVDSLARGWYRVVSDTSFGYVDQRLLPEGDGADTGSGGTAEYRKRTGGKP
jgi:hypothetical protein